MRDLEFNEAQREKIFFLFALMYLGAKLHILFNYTLTHEFIMDEFSQAYKSVLINEFYNTFIPIKNVLYAYFFNFAHLLSDKADLIIIFARIESFMTTLIVCALLYKTSKKCNGDKVFAILSVCVLLSFSTYMERSFRVRSDTLAHFFSFFAFYLLVCIVKDGKRYPYYIFPGLIIGLALLTTQKSLYYLIAMSGGIFCMGFQQVNMIKNAFFRIGMFGLGVVISMLLYCFYFAPSNPSSIMITMVTAPLKVALVAADYYPTIKSFLIQTVSRNQFGYGLSMLCLIYGLFHFRSIDQTGKLVTITSLLMALFVFSHNQPWPYVFIMLLPFLAVSVGVIGPTALATSLSTSSTTSPTTTLKKYDVGLVFLLLCVLSFPKNIQYLGTKNTRQLLVVQNAQSLLIDDETYADGIGMVVNKKRAASHVGLDAMTRSEIFRNNKLKLPSALDDILQERPRVWIVNYRVSSLYPIIHSHLTNSYTKVYPNVLITGKCLLPSSEAEFVTIIPGKYSIYNFDGTKSKETLTINGQTISGSTQINLEDYRILNNSSESLCLLPDGRSYAGINPLSSSSKLYTNSYR